MPLRTTIHHTPDLPADLLAAWDALAVERSEPYCAPDWMLAWWRQARPPDSHLRIVTVEDGGRLVGIAPLYAERDRWGVHGYGVLAGPASGRAVPLAARGREREVVAALADAIASLTPRPDLLFLSDHPATSCWPQRLRATWPGRRPYVWLGHRERSPFVTVEGTFDEWLQRRSRNFRQQLRRRHRQLAAAGATYRVSGVGDVERDVAEFARLHYARWEPRGGSSALNPAWERMLVDAAATLIPQDRFRLVMLEVDGRCIGAHLFVRAGRRTVYFLGGFDDGWGRFQPSLQTLAVELEAAFARGDRRFSLGGGDWAYKARFADADEILDEAFLVPLGPGHPLVRARLLPRQARRAVLNRLSQETKERIRKALGMPTLGHLP